MLMSRKNERIRRCPHAQSRSCCRSLAVDGLQINTRIQFSLDTDFPEDWYSGSSESGTEAAPHDPASAAPVTVTAGEGLTGIDILIEAFVPGWCMNVVSGYKPGQPGEMIPATLGILLLPFLFLYLIRKAAAR